MLSPQLAYGCCASPSEIKIIIIIAAAADVSVCNHFHLSYLVVITAINSLVYLSHTPLINTYVFIV